MDFLSNMELLTVLLSIFRNFVVAEVTTSRK